MILPFDKLSRNDADQAGGKWASLGELTQAGIAIPPGFVVLAETFEEFIDSNNLRAEIQTILKHLDHNNVSSIEHASEKIQELIRGGVITEKIQKEVQKHSKTIKTDFVAVRSSATAEDWADHAWAWQLDTYLNVSKTDIIAKILSCWASLFTPRALFYRSEKWLQDLHISVAVVVQSMVDAESAGVAFSVHPVTENTDEIVIEWSWWLGEAVVSGEVTPDSFVISKSSWEIISEHIAEKKKGIWRNTNGENEWRNIEKHEREKPILTKKELWELSQLIIKIENHYGFPCDIEWAHSKGKMYILQARPITTLQKKDPSISRDTWQNACNFVFKRLASKTNWYNKSYAWYFIGICAQGHAIAKEMGENDFAMPYGVLIPNHSKDYHWDWFWDENEMRRSREVLLEFIKISPYVSEEILTLQEKKHAEFISLYEQLSCEKLKDKSKSELGKTIEKLFNWLLACSNWSYTVDTLLSSWETDWLEEFIRKNLWDVSRDHLALLTAPTFNSFVNESEFSIKKIALAKMTGKNNYKKLQKEYLKKYDWVEWSYEDIPRMTIPSLDLKIDEICKSQSEEELQKEISLESDRIKKNRLIKKRILKENNANSSIENILHFSEIMTHVQDLRKERVLRMNTMLYELVREVENAGNIPHPLGYYFSVEEIIELCYWKVYDLEVISKRKEESCIAIFYKEKTYIFPANFYKWNNIEQNLFGHENNNEYIQWTTAYWWKIVWRVSVLTNSSEISNFVAWNILIANQTTPDYVPAMKKAIAFITDQGGITCHAAIISRELKIPCIIGTKNATKILKDGDLVEVDAENGVVKILT